MIDSNHLIVIVLFVASAMTMVGLYIRRTSPVVKNIVSTAIIEAEKAFNGGQGQEKLEFAVIVIRSRLPRIVSVFVTKRMLVSMIEVTLNKIAKTFEINKVVDIVGNEDRVRIDVDAVVEKEVVKKDNGEVYASLKNNTDWKDNTNTSIEVGFKKKL
ncbi:MAG: hypothetical protein ACRCZ0_01905 [Cetobacterium sp.]